MYHFITIQDRRTAPPGLNVPALLMNDVILLMKLQLVNREMLILIFIKKELVPKTGRERKKL